MPKFKKIVGIIFIIIGILALITPFTPGSWLAFIGLQILGIDFLWGGKIKKGLKNKNASGKITNTRGIKGLDKNHKKINVNQKHFISHINIIANH